MLTTDRKGLMLPFDGSSTTLRSRSGEFERFAAREDLVLDGHEFVATDPGRNFSWLQFRGDSLRDCRSRMIATDVAVDVVDVLERSRSIARTTTRARVVAVPGEQIVELLRQSVAVRQAGQRVVHRLMLEALGRLMGGLQIDRVGGAAIAIIRLTPNDDAGDHEGIGQGLRRHRDVSNTG